MIFFKKKKRKIKYFIKRIRKRKNNSEAWVAFMPKYFYCYHLFRYKKFFKEHLINNFKQCLKDKLYRLEARYRPNLITDENYNIIPIEEELSIIQESLNEIRKIDKDFSFCNYNRNDQKYEIWKNRKHNEIKF